MDLTLRLGIGSTRAGWLSSHPGPVWPDKWESGANSPVELRGRAIESVVILRAAPAVKRQKHWPSHRLPGLTPCAQGERKGPHFLTQGPPYASTGTGARTCKEPPWHAGAMKGGSLTKKDREHTPDWRSAVWYCSWGGGCEDNKFQGGPPRTTTEVLV